MATTDTTRTPRSITYLDGIDSAEMALVGLSRLRGILDLLRIRNESGPLLNCGRQPTLDEIVDATLMLASEAMSHIESGAKEAKRSLLDLQAGDLQ